MEAKRKRSASSAVCATDHTQKRRINGSGTKRRRERSESVSHKRRRTSDHTARPSYAQRRVRKAVKRASSIMNKLDRIRAEQQRLEREREIAHAARLAEVALMRRVMVNNPYMGIRDPRISAVAARLGGVTQDDFLYVKAQMEVSPWSVITDPFTRSALHRLCAMEAGDN